MCNHIHVMHTVTRTTGIRHFFSKVYTFIYVISSLGFCIYVYITCVYTGKVIRVTARVCVYHKVSESVYKALLVLNFLLYVNIHTYN